MILPQVIMTRQVLEKSVTRKRTTKIEPTIENMARLQKLGMKKEADEMFKKWVASPLCCSLQEILTSIGCVRKRHKRKDGAPHCFRIFS